MPEANIQTVGELIEFLQAFDPAAPVRFNDPDTNWMMHFKPVRLDAATEWGADYGEWVVIDTEGYHER